uniref:Portal protein dodecamer 3.3A n=1 Tax=Myoviridae sp. ctWiL39 TaxID=2825120 RepID=A0A8S5PX91_9CAUD|nr:MAG TPA: Portal protein dodecamer 3.3A [Myoviridae sp. ctWiL39]
MKIKTDARAVWEEYQGGRDYNNAIGLYENYALNERFYVGDQWAGAKANDMLKPTMNFLKRVVAYMVATLVADETAVYLSPFVPDADLEELCRMVSGEVERVIEDNKIKAKYRKLIRNGAVDGDYCLYFYFDPDAETGQEAQGEIRSEIVENINVIFGNPYCMEAQKQPWIMIVQRRLVEEVQDEAKASGGDADDIHADDDATQGETSNDGKLCTVLTKIWREEGEVWCQKSTQDAIVRKKWNTGYKLYPVAFCQWEEVKSSYHGQALLTGLIQNQIATNKIFAMAVRHVELLAFPKIAYDVNKIERWTNRVGEAIEVVGNPNEAIAAGFRAPDMSYQVMELVDKTVSMTRDFMGASDAALGNVRPDNTSAIIAVQEASAVPLELQKLAFYQFVEDYVRIIVDMMRQNYGTRYVVTEGQDEVTGEPTNTMVLLDFAQLEDINLRVKVDVGAAAYWSELTQVQTLDNLFNKQIITDPVDYLEAVPDRYIKNKNKIIESVKRQQAMQQQQLAQMQAAQQMQQQIDPNML